MCLLIGWFFFLQRLYTVWSVQLKHTHKITSGIVKRIDTYRSSNFETFSTLIVYSVSTPTWTHSWNLLYTVSVILHNFSPFLFDFLKCGYLFNQTSDRGSLCTHWYGLAHSQPVCVTLLLFISQGTTRWCECVWKNEHCREYFILPVLNASVISSPFDKWLSFCH